MGTLGAAASRSASRITGRLAAIAGTPPPFGSVKSLPPMSIVTKATSSPCSSRNAAASASCEPPRRCRSRRRSEGRRRLGAAAELDLPQLRIPVARQLEQLISVALVVAGGRARAPGPADRLDTLGERVAEREVIGRLAARGRCGRGSRARCESECSRHCEPDDRDPLLGADNGHAALLSPLGPPCLDRRRSYGGAIVASSGIALTSPQDQGYPGAGSYARR